MKLNCTKTFWYSVVDETVAAVDCPATAVQEGANDEEVQVDVADDKDNG